MVFCWVVVLIGTSLITQELEGLFLRFSAIWATVFCDFLFQILCPSPFCRLFVFFSFFLSLFFLSFYSFLPSVFPSCLPSFLLLFLSCLSFSNWFVEIICVFWIPTLCWVTNYRCFLPESGISSFLTMFLMSIVMQKILTSNVDIFNLFLYGLCFSDLRNPSPPWCHKDSLPWFLASFQVCLIRVHLNI